jgi:hypothetical protein
VAWQAEAQGVIMVVVMVEILAQVAVAVLLISVLTEHHFQIEL